MAVWRSKTWRPYLLRSHVEKGCKGAKYHHQHLPEGQKPLPWWTKCRSCPMRRKIHLVPGHVLCHDKFFTREWDDPSRGSLQGKQSFKASLLKGRASPASQWRSSCPQKVIQVASGIIWSPLLKQGVSLERTSHAWSYQVGPKQWWGHPC